MPSLKGVWYRGPFQHAGAVKTLDEWFDPARLERVPGHPFGLDADAATIARADRVSRDAVARQLPVNSRAIGILADARPLTGAGLDEHLDLGVDELRVLQQIFDRIGAGVAERAP